MVWQRILVGGCPIQVWRNVYDERGADDGEWQYHGEAWLDHGGECQGDNEGKYGKGREKGRGHCENGDNMRKGCQKDAKQTSMNVR